MADETDRVAMVSDLTALKTDLLAAVEKRFVEERGITRGHITDSAEELRRDISAAGEATRRHIAAEGEATRRHFDIVAEQMKDSVKVVAELAAHHSVVVDDHERRLRKIEKRR